MTPDEPAPPFDSYADDYELHATENAYNALYDRPAVLEMLGDVSGQRVLDVGCGPGLYAEELLSRGAEVVGFDQGERMVELARERLGERAELHIHDLTEPLTWLETDSFDSALMALVIHHLQDRVSALAEVHRVLRPQGRLVVSTHHPTSDWLRHGGSYFTVEEIEETWHRGWKVSYWRLPLSQSFHEFTAAGFSVERLEEPRPLPEMAERFPDDFEKLSQRPGFVNFLLRKH